METKIKSITELKYESLPMGFDNGQVRLTDENIGRILRFSGAPLGLLRCCEAKGSGTVVLYGDGQAFIIPVETRYFLDCIGEYLDMNMARRRKTTMGLVGKKSNNVIFLGAGLVYVPVKVDVPWVSAKQFSYLNWHAVYRGHDRRARALVTAPGLVIPYRQRPGRVQEKLDEGWRVREMFIERHWPVYGEWLHCKTCGIQSVCLEWHHQAASPNEAFSVLPEAHKINNCSPEMQRFTMV